MGMLDKEDLRQIGELFDQKFDEKFDAAFDRKFAVAKKEIVDEVVTGVGEMIEQNVLPQFGEIRQEMKAGFNRLDNRIDGLERRVDKLDGKVNAVVNVLHGKRVFTEQDKASILS